MSPLADTANDVEISAYATVAEIAATVEASAEPHRVIDTDGQAIGLITRQAVINVLVGRR